MSTIGQTNISFRQPHFVDTTGISTRTAYTLVDLCCGCGGFSLGFTLAGYQPLLGIECEHWAAETYRRNLLGVPVLESAVERLTEGQILDALQGRQVDVVCAGLPCQGISTNNKHRDAGEDRNWLFTQLARLVGLLRPHVVVVENVASLLSWQGGLFADWVCSALGEVGYDTVGREVLNAADYSVPQRRNRAIIVANPWGLGNPYPKPILAAAFHRSVDSAIGDLRGLPAGAIPDHDWPRAGARQDRIRSLSPGDPLYEDFTGCSHRLRPDEVAYTIMGSSGVPHIHPHEDRFLSVREMARLQGFPDEFLFYGTLSSKQAQVGNAVPPPLAEHVALALRVMLDEIRRQTIGAEEVAT